MSDEPNLLNRRMQKALSMMNLPEGEDELTNLVGAVITAHREQTGFQDALMALHAFAESREEALRICTEANQLAITENARLRRIAHAAGYMELQAENARLREAGNALAEAAGSGLGWKIKAALAAWTALNSPTQESEAQL